jgi:hypothetical protein
MDISDAEEAVEAPVLERERVVSDDAEGAGIGTDSMMVSAAVKVEERKGPRASVGVSSKLQGPRLLRAS